MFDGLAFDGGPLAQDIGGPAEVGVRRRHVAQALVVSGIAEGCRLGVGRWHNERYRRADFPKGC